MENKNHLQVENTQYVFNKKKEFIKKVVFPIFILFLSLLIIIGVSVAINHMKKQVANNQKSILKINNASNYSLGTKAPLENIY